MDQIIFKLVFMISLSTTCSTLNLTRLMSIYINSCGENGVCKDWPGLTGYQMNSIQSRCPSCSCENTCLRENTCCPDKFFERKLTRFYEATFQWSPLGEKYAELPKYHVVDYCPEFSEVLDKCINPDMNFKNRIFVTSLVSNYTYYNIYCALCNGEKKSDIVEWDISVDENMNYFNFIDSSEVLESMIKKRSNSVIFYPSPSLGDIVFPTYIDNDEYFTEPCPSDEDLQIACSSSYVNEFRLYKNVFCYLCKLKNIKRLQQSTVTCPKSATNKIQKLCKDNPVSDLTYPYRNFYCFLCNIPTFNISASNLANVENVAKEYVFLDFSSNVHERTGGEGTSGRSLIFYNNTFNNASIINKILNIKMMEGDDISFDEPAKYTTDQLKSQLLKITSAYPHRICDQNILPNFIQNDTIRDCDCSFSCMFKNPCSCCLDTALIYPTKCIRNTWSQETLFKHRERLIAKIQVVHICYEDTTIIGNKEIQRKIKLLCEGELDEFDHPVLSNNVTYKNVFCFLCNTNYTIANGSIFSKPYKILDITIHCDSLLQFDFLLHFSQVLALASINKCDIIYDVYDVVLCQTDIAKSIKAVGCQNSNRGIGIDRTENGACENSNRQSFFLVGEYTNVFCQLCYNSSTWEILDKVELCTRSGTYHLIYKDSCLTLPHIQHHDLIHPFISIFCSNCMGEYKNSSKLRSSRDCIPVRGDRISEKTDLMRELFFPTMTLRTSSFQLKSKPTVHVCYPGRKVVAGKCKPVIAFPRSMPYDLHIQCSLRGSSSTNDTEHVLSIVRFTAMDVLANFTHIGVYKVEDFYLLATPIFFKEYHEGQFYFDTNITLHCFLFYPKRYDRETVENNLLHIPYLININHTVDETEKISFVLKGISIGNMSRTLTQSKLIPEIDFLVFKDLYGLAVFDNPEFGIIVSRLLFCLQRYIDINNVHFDRKNYRIIVKDSNEVFHLGEYVIDYNRSIRVCAKIQIVAPVANSISEILDILTNILNAISIFCIILLLVIYLKFPALRTLPGMNLMSTTFSLMCMQLTYTIANVLQKGTLFCQIIGVLLHYFWLSLCCCLFICCLHMFLTFRGISVSNIKNSGRLRKVFVKYILFCYMLPLIIISLNVILSYYIDGSIGYGMRICFVENFIQNIVTFIVPLLLTCVTNVILFILTIFNIDVDNKIQKSKGNKSELVIFTKLFCLTGSVWILQVIDSFLEISFFSIVVTLLTSSQGIFMFLSFTSTSYIRNIFKSK